MLDFVPDPTKAKEAIRYLLQYVGENPDREGLLETPQRVVSSLLEMTSGYQIDVSKIFKCFEDGACDEMVVLSGISFTSLCEHHVLPFMGKAHVAYIPNKRVVGVSKLARLVEAFSRRLQLQERLTVQITQALDTHLQPVGSACLIEATHLCMVCRGVRTEAIMRTSSLTGAFRNDGPARSEFFSLIKG